MSSSPPIRWRSEAARSAALLVLVAMLLLVRAPGAAAQPPLVAVPAGTAAGQARLVVQVPDGVGGPIRQDAFSASVDGVPQPVRAQALVSDRLAMAIVVDASADGGAVLAAGLSGTANLVLAAPTSVRSTLVTDSTPPVVAVPWPSGQADTLRGLSAVRPSGDRSTAAALDLAVAQLPAGSIDPRLVVLYTGAPDAGGDPAPAVVERMRAAGVALAVVETSGGGQAASPFWTAVAAGTCGVAVAAGPGDVIAAFDEVASALQSRYLLTVPQPGRLPATVVVRVETGGGPLSSDVTVPLVAAVPADGGGSPVVALAVGAAVLLAAVGLIALVRRRAGHEIGSPRADKEDVERPEPVPQIWNIPPRPEPPVDREALQAELAATLHMGGPVWLRPGHEGAGWGTTTAMIDFAHRNRDRYDIAWWIPALDPDLIPDRMAELAEALGLATATDTADQATVTLLEALRRRHRWLLVFDDAESPREVARYLPGRPGDVLIAAADPGWRVLATPVTVPAFTRAESGLLLRSMRPGLAAEAGERIAAVLGDQPLAVGQAAALLSDTGMEVETLLSLLHDRSDDERDGDESTDIWAVAMDRLAADDPAAMALLTLVAWLGPAPLSLSLVTANPHELPGPLGAVARNRSGLVDHAAMLRRRGLARFASDDLTLHPVPATLLLARTGREHAGDGGWGAIAVRLLRAAAPDRPAAEPRGWPTWRRLLPHVLAATDPTRQLDVVADDVSWLLAQAGGYLEARGRSTAARALFEDAHQFDVGARLRSYGEPAGAPTPEEER